MAIALMSGQTFIDALPAATLPLGGTEAVPLMQNGATVQAPASAFAALAFVIESASFTAVLGTRYGLVTASAAITVTLPAAVIGGAIELADMSKNANANPITLTAHSGDQIVLNGVGTAGAATTKTVSNSGAVVKLVCFAANTWRALVIASA